MKRPHHVIEHGALIAMHSARLRTDVSLANKNKY